MLRSSTALSSFHVNLTIRSDRGVPRLRCYSGRKGCSAVASQTPFAEGPNAIRSPPRVLSVVTLQFWPDELAQPRGYPRAPLQRTPPARCPSPNGSPTLHIPNRVHSYIYLPLSSFSNILCYIQWHQLRYQQRVLARKHINKTKSP